MGKQGRARNAKLRVDCSIGMAEFPRERAAEGTVPQVVVAARGQERESRAKAVIMSE
jgi:hypothetical protein